MIRVATARVWVSEMNMSSDHTIALMGVLFLPVAVIPVLFALPTLSTRSESIAVVWWRIGSAGPAARLGSLLLLVSADIHLTLVPAHLVEQPMTGLLFLIDGIALTAAAIAAVVRPQWRIAALALLGANVLVYALYLSAGWEGADVIGIGTKLIEVAGIVAILELVSDGARRGSPRRQLAG